MRKYKSVLICVYPVPFFFAMFAKLLEHCTGSISRKHIKTTDIFYRSPILWEWFVMILVERDDYLRIGGYTCRSGWKCGRTAYPGPLPSPWTSWRCRCPSCGPSPRTSPDIYLPRQPVHAKIIQSHVPLFDILSLTYIYIHRLCVTVRTSSTSWFCVRLSMLFWKVDRIPRLRLSTQVGSSVEEQISSIFPSWKENLNECLCRSSANLSEFFDGCRRVGYFGSDSSSVTSRSCWWQHTPFLYWKSVSTSLYWIAGETTRIRVSCRYAPFPYAKSNILFISINVQFLCFIFLLLTN